MEENTVKMKRLTRRTESAERLALTIVAHPDLERVGETALVDGPVTVSRTSPEFSTGARAARPLDAKHVSRRPVVAIRPSEQGAVVSYEHDDAYVTVAGHRIGGPMHFDAAAVQAGVLIAIEGRVGLLLYRRPGMPEELRGLGLVGVSAAIERVRAQIRAAAPLSMTVLLRGETGTGKELVAQALHATSERRSRRILAVNLAALDPSVAASELFGHQRGAFTGATDARRGYFREADGGTLFLDEVGEAPVEIQRALLRVLETHEVMPVGSDRPQSVDVRVVAATDADLEAEIASNSFRAPLLYRLAEVEIRLPALRERPVDIAVLFAEFVREQASAVGVDLSRRPDWIATELIARLLEYPWPGNVRELRNAVTAAVVHSIDLERLELPPTFGRTTLDLARHAPRDASPPAEPPLERTDLSTIDEDSLLAALEANDWRPEPAAEALGIAKTSIYQLIRRTPSIPESSRLTRQQIEAALEAAGGDEVEAARALRVPRRGLLHRMKRLGLR